MARGNQRDKAREKNAKEQASKATKLTGDPRKRLEEQANALKAKIAAKQAAAAAQGGDAAQVPAKKK